MQEIYEHTTYDEQTNNEGRERGGRRSNTKTITHAARGRTARKRKTSRSTGW